MERPFGGSSTRGGLFVCLLVCLSIGGGHPGGLFARGSIEWADGGRLPGEAIGGVGSAYLQPFFFFFGPFRPTSRERLDSIVRLLQPPSLL